MFEMSDAVVINTPFMRNNSVRIIRSEHKFHVIPNGFDKEDLRYYRRAAEHKHPNVYGPDIWKYKPDGI